MSGLVSALPDASRPLRQSEAARAFACILDGEAVEDDIRTFLTAMAARGETADEIAAAAREMRCRMIGIEAPDNAIDVCGTGGDGSHSLNVSTAVAIVVAACGVPVAKHGNRASSSRAGAADTLEALGLDLDIAEETAAKSLAGIGIAFLFAARHHPALGRLAALRRSIGQRTVFNLLGPLTNPAGVKRQLIGVPAPQFVETHIAALKMLGAERAIAAFGEDGLDEISISAPTQVAVLNDGQIITGQITPKDAGLPFHERDAIRGGDATHNAQALNQLLAGEVSAYRDAVLFNAAGALMVADAGMDWKTGAQRATQAIDSGAARALLEQWIAFR